MSAESMPDWSTCRLDPKCGSCGYSLRMLTEPRCPECGAGFAWGEALNRARFGLDGVLFEYQWRRKPVRSWLRTVGLTLVPWRLWPRLGYTARPRVVPLLAMLLITWLAYLLTVFVCDWVEDVIVSAGWRHRFGAASYIGAPFQWSSWLYRYEGCAIAASLLVLWLCSFLCRGPLREIGPAMDHVWRLVALCGVSLLAWAAAAHALMAALSAMEPWWWNHDRFDPLPAGYAYRYRGYVVLGATMISFCLGCRLYLRIRRGWLWGAIVLALASVLLILMLYSVSVRYYGTLKNPWTAMIQRRWYPGVERLLGGILSLDRGDWLGS